LAGRLDGEAFPGEGRLHVSQLLVIARLIGLFAEILDGVEGDLLGDQVDHPIGQRDARIGLN
jgi:hypothetical protein